MQCALFFTLIIEVTNLNYDSANLEPFVQLIPFYVGWKDLTDSPILPSLPHSGPDLFRAQIMVGVLRKEKAVE